MAASMRAARLHEPGQPLRIDTVEIPEPRPRDVLVQVKACGIIPNMNAIFSGAAVESPAAAPRQRRARCCRRHREGRERGHRRGRGRPRLRQSVAVLRHVRVLPCGRADVVQRGRLPGLFRLFPSLDPPAHGLSVRRLLRVHHCVAAAARASAAAGDVRAGRALRLSRDVVRGVASAHGSAAAVGLRSTASPARSESAPHCSPWALGATRILGFGRNRDVLAQLKALAPDRIEVLALGDAPIADWMRRHTDSSAWTCSSTAPARSAAAATHRGSACCAEARRNRRQYRRVDGAAGDPADPFHDHSPAIPRFELVHDRRGPADGRDGEALACSI